MPRFNSQLASLPLSRLANARCTVWNPDRCVTNLIALQEFARGFS